ELGGDERPAGADRVAGDVGEAGAAVAALPYRIDEQKADGRLQYQPGQRGTDERQQNIARRVEQPRTQPPRKAGDGDRGGPRWCRLAAHERRRRKLAHACPRRATRQLKMFMIVVVTSEMTRYTAIVMAMISIACPVWLNAVPANTENRSG